MDAMSHLSSNSSHLAVGHGHPSKAQFHIFFSWEKSLSQSISKGCRIARLNAPHQSTHHWHMSPTDDTSSAKTDVTEREQIHCHCHASRRQRICTQWYGGIRGQSGRRLSPARRRRSGSREQSDRRQARSSRGTPTWECEGSLSRSPRKRLGPVHEEAFGSECSGGTGLEAGHGCSLVRMAAVRRLGPWTPMVRERSMSAVREGPVTNVA